LAGLGFLLHHIVIPTDLTDALRERLTKTAAGIVVFGHTHKPYAETHGGVFFLNPGYTGRQRFDLPRSLVRLEIDDTSKQFRHELVWL
jgi:putative phosphoesterase